MVSFLQHKNKLKEIKFSQRNLNLKAERSDISSMCVLGIFRRA